LAVIPLSDEPAIAGSFVFSYLFAHPEEEMCFFRIDYKESELQGSLFFIVFKEKIQVQATVFEGA